MLVHGLFRNKTRLPDALHRAGGGGGYRAGRAILYTRAIVWYIGEAVRVRRQATPPWRAAMLGSFVSWLDNVGSIVFWSCVAALVAVDVVAAAVVIQTRSRELVNRWMGRILAANAMLLGAGLGVPAATYVTKLVVSAVAPSVESAVVGILPAKEDARVSK